MERCAKGSAVMGKFMPQWEYLKVRRLYNLIWRGGTGQSWRGRAWWPCKIWCHQGSISWFLALGCISWMIHNAWSLTDTALRTDFPRSANSKPKSHFYALWAGGWEYAMFRQRYYLACHNKVFTQQINLDYLPAHWINERTLHFLPFISTCLPLFVRL